MAKENERTILRWGMLAAIITILAASRYGFAAEQRTEKQKPGQPAEPIMAGIQVLRDLQYIWGGHERNKLDLYLPKQDGDKGQKVERLPLIIWVHGGAWMSGDKKYCPAVRFAHKGYAVASINYRLSQHAIFPAQIEDCKAAVRWLRANAEKYGLDPNRFGAWGPSAGGHLVALLGTTGDVNDFDKGQNLNISSRVQVVCDYFGPTDFLKMADFPSTMKHNDANSPESKLIGGAILENKEACRRANPITYITKDDPPFLIVHGDADPLVPHNQSQLLYEALQKAGVQARLHIVKDGGHGGFKDPAIEKMVDDFFDMHLIKRKTEDSNP
jgi:acetyl esterase/lipase